MANIYELSAEYLRLQNVLESMESTEADYRDIERLLDISENDLEAKAENYAKIIKNLESDLAGHEAEEKRIAVHKKQIKKAIENLKANLYGAMKTTGKTEFEKGVFKFKIKKNGGALPVIVDIAIEDLADEFVIINEKPDLTAIAEYIKSTGDISFAHFDERGDHLEIG